MGYGADIYGDTHKVSYQGRRRRPYAVVRLGFPKKMASVIFQESGEAAQRRVRLEEDCYTYTSSAQLYVNAIHRFFTFDERFSLRQCVFSPVATEKSPYRPPLIRPYVMKK